MGDGVYAVLPSLEHLHYTAFEHVYEPAEDTFLLCDGLQQERVSLVARGSGQVTMRLSNCEHVWICMRVPNAHS